MQKINKLYELSISLNVTVTLHFVTYQPLIIYNYKYVLSFNSVDSIKKMCRLEKYLSKTLMSQDKKASCP